MAEPIASIHPEPPQVEPWLRGTLPDIDPVRRAVLHALQQAAEDVERWAAPRKDDQHDAELFARPANLPSVAFHLRHIVRSLDRLLTYAEAKPLSAAQLAALTSEMSPGTAAQVIAEFRIGLAGAVERIHSIPPASFAEPRTVGRKLLPATVAGLLIHSAEHTQRHIGQMITTAKLVAATIP